MTSARRWSRLRGIAALGLAPLLAASLTGGVAQPALAREGTHATEPNIVVFYMDDFPANATQLWSDPERTPNLARFASEGTWFRDAAGSTPRCSPARANILTGRWGHNSGVTENDIGPYQPRMSVASKLQDRGYHTLFGGKYHNLLRRYTKDPADVERYAENWHQFDAIWLSDGKFYDYPLWTRDGIKRYAHKPRDHSTFVVTNRMRRHILDAPAKKPIFALLSLYDGHDPNLPLPRFKGAKACADETWWSPAFNEEDVSDKPAHIQVRPRTADEAYDLRVRCEETLTVDWAVGRITRALEKTGRLEDTVFIFTADNGWLMQEHRVDNKKVAYSTPVPLYMLWPEQWAEAPREIDEPVSNVDLAATFCDLAGCTIKHADGLSLLPLLDGQTEQLERGFIYEESLHDKGISPGWYGLRTTKGFDPEARWVYTELSTGEHELYDLVADPDQLQNQAGQPQYVEIQSELRDLLHGEVIEPNDVEFQ
jgi:N-acetylglucosamine-6-sulfatase